MQSQSEIRSDITCNNCSKLIMICKCLDCNPLERDPLPLEVLDPPLTSMVVELYRSSLLCQRGI